MLLVTANHPEVKAIVEEALRGVEQNTAPPSLDLYAEVLEKRIRQVLLI